ncbi:MAG: hypothetical protein A3F78_00365 [Burkholderiales bacterium RIFCSPLOWO2_12_FULL_61_40]|nr:MAG: hypothetical protein A3F78_00365 [Burkholderiales bacterium RIFCSPLOWO2_12_FULL_61_40]
MKKTLRTLVLVVWVALLAPLGAHAGLQTLSSLYVFGDSLSDGGNFNGPGGPGAFPPSPYVGGHYTNGLTAVEHLWQAYHPGDASFAPSNFGGTNYALGGATTGSFNYNAINPNVPTSLQPWFAAQGGVANQVAQFSGACDACFNPAESLFVAWAFPNDVFANAALGAAGLPPATLIGDAVSNIGNAILALAGEGAQHFLVPNMPDLGATPGFLGNTSLTGLTVAFNAALATALTALDQSLSAEIIQFDTFSALQQILQNPGVYGFDNVTDACVENLSNGQCDPARWVYWDGVHPTTATHALLGAELAAAVVPEPASLWLLAAAALCWLVLGGARRAARPGSVAIGAAQVGNRLAA